MSGVNEHSVCGAVFSGIFFSLRQYSLKQNENETISSENLSQHR